MDKTHTNPHIYTGRTTEDTPGRQAGQIAAIPHCPPRTPGPVEGIDGPAGNICFVFWYIPMSTCRGEISNGERRVVVDVYPVVGARCEVFIFCSTVDQTLSNKLWTSSCLLQETSLHTSEATPVYSRAVYIYMCICIYSCLKPRFFPKYVHLIFEISCGIFFHIYICSR